MKLKRAIGIFVAVTMLASMATDAIAARARQGVFGTINGKRFKATNVAGDDDDCVNGIYDVADGSVTFAALECKGKKRRRQGTAVKKNYKVLAISCANYGAAVDVSTPPFDIPCPLSAYTEYKTGRFRLPVSSTTWGATFEYPPNGIPTSSVRMRIDAIEGARVRGAIYGDFSVPLVGEASPPAAITDEVLFDFPLRLR